MAKADIEMNVRHHEDSGDGTHADNHPLIKYYRASEALPGKVPVLHNFLRKGPASCAAIQTSSGVLSFGIGVVFAASFQINHYLLTLFRVPIITGILFIFTGLLSNLLHKHPELLQTCFYANIGSLIVSGIGVILLTVDLGSDDNKIQFKMEILVLCLTLMDIIIAAVLIFFIYKEKKNHKVYLMH